MCANELLYNNKNEISQVIQLFKVKKNQYFLEHGWIFSDFRLIGKTR